MEGAKWRLESSRKTKKMVDYFSMKLAQVNIGTALFGEHAISSSTTLGAIVSGILPTLYTIAGVIAFVFLIFTGLGIIMGAGQENPEKLQKAKATFTWAMIGFLVIFGSYWIIQIIQVVTGINILTPGV
jgi:type IV secretory pathway VirB2 component (pilin)